MSKRAMCHVLERTKLEVSPAARFSSATSFSVVLLGALLARAVDRIHVRPKGLQVRRSTDVR